MFYDGDGRGGQIGAVWKARFMPDAVGSWSWTSTGSHSHFTDSGTFTVDDTGLSAPLEIDPTYPHYMRRKTGEHLFLAGDWLVIIAKGSGKVPLNYLSSSLTNANSAALRTFHSDRNLNLFSIYLQNNGDLGLVVDPFTSGGFDRYDLTNWHDWESEIDVLRDAGFSVELWMSSDAPFGFGDQNSKDLLSYAYARLGPRREVLWVLGLEVDKYWTNAQRGDFGNHLQSKNAYGRPVAVHHAPGRNNDRADPWVDYVPVQHGFSDVPSSVNTDSESNRDVTKPLYASEYASGNTDDTAARKNMWTAFVSGAYMIGNGPGKEEPTSDLAMKYLADYVNGSAAPGSRPEWWKMSPADNLVSGAEGYLQREANVRYLCFLPVGGTVTVNLTEATGTLTYDWYNPRNGSVVTGGTVQAGAPRSFTAPGSNDWLLDIRR